MSMVLFAMYLSYGITTNPCDFRVFAYTLYHNSANSMQPYNAFNSLSNSTFMPFSIHKFDLCYGFTSHMISTNSSSIFNLINLSSGMSLLSSDPGTSKTVTSLTSRARCVQVYCCHENKWWWTPCLDTLPELVLYQKLSHIFLCCCMIVLTWNKLFLDFVCRKGIPFTKIKNPWLSPHFGGLFKWEKVGVSLGLSFD